MRINLYNENRISVDSVKNEAQISSGVIHGEQISNNNKSVTMNSTDINKSRVMGLGEAAESFEDIKEKAELLKDNLAVMKDKLETGKVVNMDEVEIDVNNTEVEKIVTVVERIQIKLAIACDDFSIQGTGIDMEDIKATMGDSVASYKAAATMNDSQKAYLVKNELEPTIENVYKAIHSGIRETGSNVLTDKQWDEIVYQAENIIKEAGLDVNETTLEKSRYMIENNVDLTAKNLEYFMVLDNLEVPSDDYIVDRIKATILEGRKESQTKVTGESLPFEETAMAIQIIKNASEANIMAFSKEEVKTLDVLSDIENKNVTMSPKWDNQEYVKTYRQLQEIRLMMTIDAGRVIENSGVSVNTTELSELVDRLKEYEAKTLSEYQDEIVNVEEVTKVNDILLAMEELKTASVNIIGEVVSEDVVSLEALRSKSFSIAVNSYETMSTEVRTDLGDSVFKAINASTDDILSGMGYEDNEENRRAIRILAYNQMEMSEANIDKVKDLYVSANTLFKKMTPEKTLKMIREGVNPMTKDVRELADYFNKIPDEQKVEKYSEFLYRLEKNKGITPEEREKYMAIYSLINKFEKDGLNAVGMLHQQGMEFTMGNLLTAYMTRKSGGINAFSEIDSGVAEIKDKVSYYKHLFAGIESSVKPENMQKIQDMDKMSPEKFISEITKQEINDNNEYIMDSLKTSVNSETEIIKYLAEFEIPATPNNIIGVRNIIKKPEGILSKENGSKLIDKISDKEELIKEYEKLSTEAQNELNNSLYEKDSFLDINSLKQINTGLKLLSHLAKRNNYFIPCENNGKEIVINLKIVEEDNESGRFQITFENETYGKVSIEGKANETGINAQIISDSESGVNTFKEEAEKIKTKLLDNGYENINISVNKSDERPSIHSGTEEKSSTTKIFDIAKIFVTHFAN